MSKEISRAPFWLAAASELLDVELFSEDFRRALTKEAVKRAIAELNQCPRGAFDE